MCKRERERENDRPRTNEDIRKRKRAAITDYRRQNGTIVVVVVFDR